MCGLSWILMWMYLFVSGFACVHLCRAPPCHEILRHAGHGVGLLSRYSNSTRKQSLDNELGVTWSLLWQAC